MANYINLNELSITTQALLKKINEQADLKVDKDEVIAATNTGDIIASVGSVDIYNGLDVPESPKVVIFYRDENGDLACNYSFSDLYDIVSADNPKIPYIAIYNGGGYNTNNPLNLYYDSAETTYITFYSEYHYFTNGEREALFTGDIIITYESDGSITKQEETHEFSYDNYPEIRRQNGKYYDCYLTSSGSSGTLTLNSIVMGAAIGLSSTYSNFPFYYGRTATLTSLSVRWFDSNYGGERTFSSQNLRTSLSLTPGIYWCNGLSYSSGLGITFNVTKIASLDDIPTNVSELTNDSNFQTETQVNSLIGTAIGGINQFNVAVVQDLPTTDIDNHTIYFVPNSSSGNNVYEEWMYINSQWEMIGTTSIDLSGYVQRSEVTSSYSAAGTAPVNGIAVASALSTITVPVTDVQNSSGTSLVSNGIATIPDVPTKTSDLTNDSGYLTLSDLPIYDGTVV